MSTVLQGMSDMMRRRDILSILMLLAPYLVLLSIFGPYLLPQFGLRSEQLLIYPLALLLALNFSRLRLSPTLLGIMGWWGVILVFSTAVSIGNGVLQSNPTKFFSGIDDHLLPLALMVCMLGFLTEVSRRGDSLRAHFIRLAQLFCLLIFLNTLLTLAQTVTDLTVYLKPFWSSADLATEGMSTAEHALNMGRLTGIFNSPAQHGLAYSIALFAHALLMHERVRFRWLFNSILVFNLLGGFFSASKMYLLGGVILFIVYLLNYYVFQKLTLRKQLAVFALLLVGGIAGVTLNHFMTNGSLRGIASLLAYAQRSDFLSAVTSGRFSADAEGSVAIAVHEIMAVDGIFGAGFGFLHAVDNQVLSVYMTCGIVGIVAFLGFIGTLVYYGIILPPQGLPRSMRILIRLFVVLVILSSIGIPVFTTNRSSTMLWLFLFFFFEIKAAAWTAWCTTRGTIPGGVGAMPPCVQ